MKLTYALALLALLAGSALGADAPSAPKPFAPVTLSEQDYKDLTAYLGTRPYNEAAPLMQFLAAKEQQAQAEADKKPKK